MFVLGRDVRAFSCNTRFEIRLFALLRTKYKVLLLPYERF